MNFDDGLSDNNLSAILQDQKGFIWFGTKDGLNRYDGYNFKVFRNDPNDVNSISNNTIDCLFEDKAGNLWIGTFAGINKLERETGHFLNYSNHEPFRFNKLKGDIYDITEDKKGNIWIGTAWMGVVVLNKSGVAYEFTSEDEGLHKLSSNTVSSIVQDHDGTIWIGTTNGLNRVSSDLTKTELVELEGVMNAQSINDLLVDKQGNLWIATKAGLIFRDKASGELQYFFFDPKNPFDFGNQRNVLHLAENNEGFVFLGTARNGLIAINKKTKKWYQYQGEGSSNLSDNHIRTIHVDNAQSLWVGTNGHGINYSNSKTNMFTSYVNTGRNKNGLGEGNITSFYKDSENRFWVSVDGNGLHLFDEKTRKFKQILPSSSSNSANSNNIRSITEDNSGRLWLATFGSKVIIYDPNKRAFEKTPKYLKPLSDELSTLYKDSQNRIWIGSENGGVFLVDQQNESLTNYVSSSEEPSSLSYNHVTFFYEDQNQTIWIGTNKGLNKFNEGDQTFTTYLPDSVNPSSISSVAVTSMIQDQSGTYWIGTAGGLNEFDAMTNKFKHYGTKDGLSSKVIYAIQEDEKGNLWISTDNGITFFGNGKNRVVRTFTQRDGLQGKEFSQGASYKNKQGVLYFGGSLGFTEIVPGSIKKNTTPPPVHLTGLRLFYETVVPGEKSILQKPISETEKLTLDYSQNVLTFEFTALNFIVSSKNEYMYQLEGFDKKWINVENVRSATYTNLNPGSYTFRVKASNNDGVWNEEGTSIRIEITPPYWMTWWFKLLIGLLAGAIVLTIFKLRVRTIRNRNKILEQRVLERTEQIEAQKEEIEAQRDEILSTKTQIEESIEVGKIIQDAILPPVELIRDRFPNSFVYYQAKDIVSGDFYWFYRKGKKSYIAAADCTGHGVAGGFLTMIGQNHLHDIAESDENLRAADILNQLNQRVIKSLRQRPEHMETRDGMDITLCIFEDDSQTIQFAGAKNPIYLIRNGAEEIEKHDVDIFSIGIPIRGAVREFQNKELTLKEGDMIYLFSDGYADQFNEDYVEKFKHSRFRKTLLEIHKEKPETQRGILEKTIMVWKGEEEQTDDMLVMGIRI